MEQPTWRPIVGWEDLYLVSDQGQVWSIRNGAMLKPWTSNGYPTVGLYNGPRIRRAQIHILMLETFVGPRPEGLVGCHYDDDSLNNQLPNLRWDTYSENNKDLVRHGTHGMARKTHCPSRHEYTPENTRNYLYGGIWRRYCRICEKAKNRRAKAKLKAHRAAHPQKCGAPLLERCKRGHEFTPENTYTRPDGQGRSCRQCQSLRSRERSH